MLLPQIEVRELPDGARYTFPQRKLGPVRFFALFLIAFGLVFSGLAVFWIAGASGVGRGRESEIENLLFALFGIPFVFAGLIPIGLALFVLAGHAEVELKGGRLRAIERAGWLKWTRSRPAESVRRLVATRSPVKVNDKPVTTGPLTDLAALKAECEGAKPMMLAMGYPLDWLTALAGELSKRRELRISSGPVQVEEEETGAAAPEAPVERPAGTKVILERYRAGLRIIVPSAGLRRGSKGLFTVAVFWNLIVGLITGSILIGFSEETPWFVFLFVGAFWAIGIGILLGALNMGRRQASIELDRDSLVIVLSGIFGTKRRKLPREQISEIGAGPSGMSVNDVPVIELQIHPKSGKKIGLLAGRDEVELRWMAAELAQTLKV